MTTGGTESILLAVKAARERGRAERGVTRPEHGAADDRPRRVREGRALLRRGEPARAGAGRLARRRRGDGRRRRRQHGARRRLGAAVPAGRDRPGRRGRRAGRRAGHQLPRRRLHGRRHAPLPRAARPRRAAVRLPRRRRHVDVGRPAQVRLHGQGRLGDRPPHQGAAALPDLRDRQLARRHSTARRASSARSRAAPSPRRGPCCTTSATTATCASPRSPAPPPRRWPRASRAQPGWCCGPSPRRRCWPSAPPIPTALDVFAVADALWRRGWYVDRQGPPPSLHCTVNAVHDAPHPRAAWSTCRAALDEVLTAGARGDRGAYGTVE